MTARIGPADRDAADDFTFYVCTPRMFERVLSDESHVWGRHLLVLEQFSWQAARRAIGDLFEQTSGATWEELAARLGRYGHWECEDYVEHT
jgi:hypothetical protein